MPPFLEQPALLRDQQIAQQVMESFQYFEQSLLTHHAQVANFGRHVQQALHQFTEARINYTDAEATQALLQEEQRAHSHTKSILQQECNLLAKVKFAALAERQKNQHEDGIKLARIRYLEAELGIMVQSQEELEITHAQEKAELTEIITGLEQQLESGHEERTQEKEN